MIKYFLILLAIAGIETAAFAKKVKFAVDMGNEIVNATGVHLSGDFQTAAGYSSDWCADCTPLILEGATNIYSIIVDIPAFKKYEYKFLNGDQFYEAEFVPIPSRVNYDFNDNRWIYIDSLGNDTTYIGAILFSGNAPSSLALVRFFVNTKNISVSPNGIHVAGDFQSWDTKKTSMYHFDNAPAGVYEIISYVIPNPYVFKYYNGNTNTDTESVPAACAANGNRNIVVTNDTLLDIVCFSGCTDCGVLGSIDYFMNPDMDIYPNPTPDMARISFKNNTGNKVVIITDSSGKIVRKYPSTETDSFQIEKGNLQAGLYFVSVLYSNNTFSKSKLILN